MSRRHAALIAALVLLTVPVAAGAAGPAPAPEGSFTVVVLPDTQDYADGGSPSGDYSGQEVFAALTQWIVGNREAQRIVFVSHVGDIVNLSLIHI